MVKNGKKKAGGNPKPNKASRSVPMSQITRNVGPAGGLDRPAKEWARLMMDPCSAPLVPPCYSTGCGSAMLIRSEYDYLTATGAVTATVAAFIPGLNAVAAETSGLVTDTTAASLTLQSGAAPSGAWLDANAGSVRCVAARAEISYPGTELTRSGIIGLGLMDGGAFHQNLPLTEGGANVGITAAQTRRMCQHVERMPSTMAAINWAPGPNDENPDTTLLDATRAAKMEGRNALVVTASGFPANTGVRIRFVAVYEITLLSNSIGVVNSVDPPPSRNTPGQILKAMYDSRPGWVVEPSQAATQMNYTASKNRLAF